MYEIDSAKLCKEMWEVCVERVSFYKLVAISVDLCIYYMYIHYTLIFIYVL